MSIISDDEIDLCNRPVKCASRAKQFWLAPFSLLNSIDTLRAIISLSLPLASYNFPRGANMCAACGARLALGIGRLCRYSQLRALRLSFSSQPQSGSAFLHV